MVQSLVEILKTFDDDIRSSQPYEALLDSPIVVIVGLL